jgi:hypothetical protein
MVLGNWWNLNYIRLIIQEGQVLISVFRQLGSKFTYNLDIENPVLSIRVLLTVIKFESKSGFRSSGFLFEI